MPSQRFRDAVEKTNGLERAYEPGIQAISSQYRKRVKPGDPQRLAGSVDLDHALANSRPNDPRWDYGIGLQETTAKDRVVWIEIHPASSSGNANEVIKKLQWLKNWLKEMNSPLLQMNPTFNWLATGGVRFNRKSPTAARILRENLQFPCSTLNL